MTNLFLNILNMSKTRIKNILNYKKPKFCFIIFAPVIVEVLAVALITNLMHDDKSTNIGINAIDMLLQNDSNSTVKETKIVASIPEKGIFLSAVDTGEMYKDFKLKIGDFTRYLKLWKNINVPAFVPQLILSDINQDKQDELIVILTTGEGTGINKTEAHVVNVGKFYESYVDDTRSIILKNLITKISNNVVEITIGNKTTKVDIKHWNISPENLFKNVVFDNIIIFDVIENELIANVVAQISPTVFIGDIKISYIYKDDIYQSNEIKFIKYE